LAWTQGQRRVAFVRSGDSVRGGGGSLDFEKQPHAQLEQ
jgi:hypothetical protein